MSSTGRENESLYDGEREREKKSWLLARVNMMVYLI